MEIIPVIDLKAGQVVHAKAGLRQAYQPIQSTLCQDAEPLVVIKALLDRYTFNRLYIADLDAITANGNHDEKIRSIQQQFPLLELWVDAGIRTQDSLRQFYQQQLGRPVIGSETLTDCNVLTDMANRHSRPILSLDYHGTDFLGISRLQSQPELWPEEVIVMSLDHVGGQLGPDTVRLQRLKNLAGPRRLYAAGGVRNNRDVSRLASIGVAGALVATALHHGQITAY